MGITIGVIGLGLAATGIGTQVYASQKASKQQQELEAQRKQQMELDAERRKREIIRSQISARASALSTATNQGAAAGSVIEGAYGGISGRSNVNELGVNQNLQIGENISNLNAGLAKTYGMQNLGSGLTTFGEGLLKNEGAYNRVGTYFSSFFGSRESGQGAYA